MGSLSFSFIPINIPSEKNGNLVQTLESFMPSTAQILNLIRVKEQKLFSQENTISFNFLSYEEETTKDSGRDWSNNRIPLFILCIFKTSHNSITQETRTLYSRDTPSSKDSQLVEQFSKLFDWNDPSPLGFGTDARYTPFLEEVCNRQEREFTVRPTCTMFMEKDDALLLQKDIHKIHDLRPLDPIDAEIVNSHWKYGSKSSLPFIRDQISNSISAGLFINGEPVCWVITLAGTLLNSLYTLDTYRKKGYAEIVMKYACVQSASKGLYPMTGYEPDNLVSRHLIHKLGFNLAFDSAWMYCIKRE